MKHLWQILITFHHVKNLNKLCIALNGDMSLTCVSLACFVLCPRTFSTEFVALNLCHCCETLSICFVVCVCRTQAYMGG
jgi:hypothetical protein